MGFTNDQKDTFIGRRSTCILKHIKEYFIHRLDYLGKPYNISYTHREAPTCHIITSITIATFGGILQVVPIT